MAFDADEFSKMSVNFFPVIMVVVVVSFIFYTATKDKTSMGSSAYTYSAAILIPFILAFVYLVYSVNSGTSGTTGINKLFANMSNDDAETPFWNILLILKIIFLIYIVQYLTYPEYILNLYITYVFIFVIVVLGLAILYNVLINYFAKIDGWTGFAVNLIFYIPCLVIDLIKYIKSEFGVTPNVVFIIFVLEVLVILAYVTLPYIMRKVTSSKGTVLVSDPIFLDTKMPLLTSNQLPSIQRETQTDMSGNQVLTGLLATTVDVKNGNYSNVYYKNYAISMWIFVNPQPASSLKEQIIFEYDNTNLSYNYPKPRITYYSDPVSSSDVYLIYFTTPMAPNYSMTVDDDAIASRFRLAGLSPQKWNQFVFNYVGSKADLFINGELVTSFDLTGQMPTYNVYDHISMGQDNGLDGAICNAMYYTHPLTNMEIVNAYNLLQFRNPPI